EDPSAHTAEDVNGSAVLPFQVSQVGYIDDSVGEAGNCPCRTASAHVDQDAVYRESFFALFLMELFHEFIGNMGITVCDKHDVRLLEFRFLQDFQGFAKRWLETST